MVDLRRRDFLKAAGSIWGATLLASQIPAIALAASQARDKGRFRTLSPSEARELEAVAARIIPTTDTPGAREAGAIWFIDQALAGTMAGVRPIISEGLAALQADGNELFSMLTETAQDALLKRHETTVFFGQMRFLTLAGTFAMPGHGGNRDHLGWQLLGFDHRHAWSPPFGYYDAQANDSEETRT
jgi:gluconate 2-dehydrogenase gamma chain